MTTEGIELLGFDTETLCVLGVAILVWIAMLGLSLKLAFKVTGADPPGYFGCLGYALLIPIVNGFISTLAYSTIGMAFGLVGILQLYIQIKILKFAGNCGGWRAFFSGIVHGFFTAFGTVAIVLTVVFSGLIERETIQGPMQELAEKAKQEHQARREAAADAPAAASFIPWTGSRTADGAQINPYVNADGES